MREIDLIPRDYLQARQHKRWIAAAALAAALLLAATLAARLVIEMALAQQRPILASLQHSARAAVSQRAELAALEQRQIALQARLDTLQRLRQPAAWKPALHSVDRAFGAGLWFDQLAFTQAVVPPAAAVAATPAAASAPALAGWQTTQTLDIKGHAVDHAGVMAFIGLLREQPALQGVRLVDTAVRRYSMADVIDFSVASRVEPAPGGQP